MLGAKQASVKWHTRTVPGKNNSVRCPAETIILLAALFRRGLVQYSTRKRRATMQASLLEQGQRQCSLTPARDTTVPPLPITLATATAHMRTVDQNRRQER
jgi:hypothetical protein